MNNKNEIIVIYKEVGKKPELKKIQNELNAFKNLLGGELDYIQYKDITIIARKNRKRLQPNIYLNTTMLNIIDRNIRGNIIVTGSENEKFKSLTKKQAMQYQRFLQEESFNYNSFDNKNTYIPKTNKSQFIIEKEIGDNDTTTITENAKQNADTNETLKMILAIQTIILKFIKKKERLQNFKVLSFYLCLKTI